MIILEKVDVTRVKRTDAPIGRDVPYSFNSSPLHHAGCKHTTTELRNGKSFAKLEHCPSKKTLHIHLIQTEPGADHKYTHRIGAEVFKEIIKRPHDIETVTADPQSTQHVSKFMQNRGGKMVGGRFVSPASGWRKPRYQR
jgi:hypothetical protein